MSKACHDCKAMPGELHHYGCDVERCPDCGGQLISCGCDNPPMGRRMAWDGEWPGTKECREFDLWCRWTLNGWVPCDADHPEAREDLNTLGEMFQWDRELRRWVRPVVQPEGGAA